MTRYYLLKVALVLYSLVGDQHSLRPANSIDIRGDWMGDYQTVSLGQCGWKEPTIPVSATFRIVNDSIIGRVTSRVGTTMISTHLVGRVSLGPLALAQVNDAICYGTLRTYVNHFEATFQADKLTLVSRDTLCPEQDCIFLRTLTLTRR